MAPKERVLFVDSDQNLLNAVGRHLIDDFDVQIAPDVETAARILEEEAPFAVIVVEAHLDGTKGIEFLKTVREQAPNMVRIMATARSDFRAVAIGVNVGHIFKVLHKPFPLARLVETLKEGVERYRNRVGAKVRHDQALNGAVKMMHELLSLANPAAYGRSSRARQFALDLAYFLEVPDRWAIEVAALLSQIGCVTLPVQTTEKLNLARALTHGEEELVSQLPAVTSHLLGHIPEFEPVREILAYVDKNFDGSGPRDDRRSRQGIPLGARILRLVLDYDTLLSQGIGPQVAMETLEHRRGAYDPELLEAMQTLWGGEDEAVQTVEVQAKNIKPGMVFATNLVSAAGNLLIARGQEASEATVERVRHLSDTGAVAGPFLMIIPRHCRILQLDESPE